MSRSIDFADLPSCPVPVIFLDTHVISSMAKWKMAGEANSIALNRAKILYGSILRLVKTKKLICPEVSTWGDEYRLDSKIREACEMVVVDLAQGISFRSPSGIENSQMQIAMKAHVQNAESVDYLKEWAHMYHQDPITQLLQKNPFVVRFNWAEAAESYEERRERKRRLRDKLTGVKQADSIRTPSFEQKLEEEYQGYINGTYKLGLKPLERRLVGKSPTPEEGLTAAMTLGMHLVFWEKAEGKPDGISGLAQFYRSQYLRSVPRIEITAKLWAALAVYLKRAKAKGSDAADIAMISTVLPYADFLLLDKTMTNLVRDRLRLDGKYNATVFDMSDCDELLAELETIEKRESPLKDVLQ